jgi:hypothetical protein
LRYIGASIEFVDGHVLTYPGQWFGADVVRANSGTGAHGAVTSSAATHNIQFITTLGTYQGTNTW